MWANKLRNVLTAISAYTVIYPLAHWDARRWRWPIIDHWVGSDLERALQVDRDAFGNEAHWHRDQRD